MQKQQLSDNKQPKNQGADEFKQVKGIAKLQELPKAQKYFSESLNNHISEYIERSESVSNAYLKQRQEAEQKSESYLAIIDELQRQIGILQGIQRTTVGAGCSIQEVKKLKGQYSQMLQKYQTHCGKSPRQERKRSKKQGESRGESRAEDRADIQNETENCLFEDQSQEKEFPPKKKDGRSAKDQPFNRSDYSQVCLTEDIIELNSQNLIGRTFANDGQMPMMGLPVSRKTLFFRKIKENAIIFTLKSLQVIAVLTIAAVFVKIFIL